MKDIENPSEPTRTVKLNDNEAAQIRYALSELSFTRAEQAFDFGKPELAKESQYLKKLAQKFF
jgi:hypothetical protein